MSSLTNKMYYGKYFHLLIVVSIRIAYFKWLRINYCLFKCICAEITFLFQTRKAKSETVFEIRTKKLDQVPIIDFFPVDYGLPHQAFGFEVGPVCFKWYSSNCT